MMNGTFTKKQIILISCALLAVILLPILIRFIASFRDPYPNNGIKLQNLHRLTRGNPRSVERVRFIQDALFGLVQMNSDETLLPDLITDAYLRPEAFEQGQRENGVHFIDGLVDIDSLEMTFVIRWEWVDDARDEGLLDQWGSMVLCPTAEQSRFPDFVCTDALIEMAGPTDEIMNYFPIMNMLFRLRWRIEEDDSFTILVETTDTYLDGAVGRLREVPVNLAQYRIEWTPESPFVTNLDLETTVINSPQQVLSRLYPARQGQYSVDCREVLGDYTVCLLEQPFENWMLTPPVAYRALLVRSGGGWLLTGTPEPILNVFNNPNVPLPVLTRANDMY
ncbi:hypothetical protein FWH13_01255 [Candidatus Saccharibacteria bacterium]|nr:hypothetical protein [Candidatus Saccharibacteria bacterium]